MLNWTFSVGEEMKRIVYALLTLVMSLVLITGCGTENASQGTKQEAHTITDIGGALKSSVLQIYGLLITKLY